MRPPRHPHLWLAALLPFFGGCSRDYYVKWADEETYGVIGEKTPLVENMDPEFSIVQSNLVSLEGLAEVAEALQFLGPSATLERGAKILTLEKTLQLAVGHSRLYQNQKEQLFLVALSLTGSRHQFTPIFSGTARSHYSVDTEQVVAFEPDPDNPGNTKPVLSDDLVEQSRVSASGTVRADWLLRDVGRISGAFTADFLRFLGGDPRSPSLLRSSEPPSCVPFYATPVSSRSRNCSLRPNAISSTHSATSHVSEKGLASKSPPRTTESSVTVIPSVTTT